MKKKLLKYIEEVEGELASKKRKKNLSQEILTEITFFQHERLVHLIATFFTGVATVLFLLGFLYFITLSLLVLFMISLALFVPYIFHYYYLENGVQRLYDLYREATSKENKIKFEKHFLLKENKRL